MTEFTKSYIVKEEHMDVQGFMNELYYPFYMECCRHDFIREILGFDFETGARNGIYMLLLRYSIRFLRPLKKNDHFTVTCALFANKEWESKLHFKQSILLNGKVMTTGIFTGICVRAVGRKPCLPDIIAGMISGLPQLNVDGSNIEYTNFHPISSFIL